MNTKILKVGKIIVNTLIAVFGAGIIGSALGGIFRVHSPSGVVIKEWIVSVVLSLLLGLAVQNLWRNSAAKWAWFLPVVFFSIGILLSIPRSSNVLAVFSGYSCASLLEPVDCRDFFVFTIPLVRATVYSIAAWLGSPHESIDNKS